MADDWEGPTPEDERRINEFAVLIEERTVGRIARMHARTSIMHYFLNGASVEEAFRQVAANIEAVRYIFRNRLAPQDLERHPERRLQPVSRRIDPDGDITDAVSGLVQGGQRILMQNQQDTIIRLALDLLDGKRFVSVMKRESDGISYRVPMEPSLVTPYTALSPLRQLALQALRPGMEYNRNLASSLMDEIASEWGVSWSERPDEPVTEKWILAGGDFTYDPGTHESGVLTQRGEDGVMPIRLYFLLDPSTRIAHGWGLVFNDAGSSQRIRSTPTVRRVLRLCDTLGIPLKERS